MNSKKKLICKNIYIYCYDTVPPKWKPARGFGACPQGYALRSISRSIYDRTHSHKENHPIRYIPSNRVLISFFKTIIELIPHGTTSLVFKKIPYQICSQIFSL